MAVFDPIETAPMDSLREKAVTTYVHPPIPIRAYDWLAYIEGDEEEGPQGWGATEEEALKDLAENMESA